MTDHSSHVPMHNLPVVNKHAQSCKAAGHKVSKGGLERAIQTCLVIFIVMLLFIFRHKGLI